VVRYVFEPLGVDHVPTSVALAPPEQNIGVPVPVNVVLRESFRVSPEVIKLEVAVKLAGTTTLGEEQVPPEIEP
jgi:hypothetical protein